MNVTKGKIANPSSPPISTPTTPCSNQAPTSIEDTLHTYGISMENAQKWNFRYNRESIPKIPDEDFYKLLTGVGGPTNNEFEFKVRRIIDERCSQSRTKFDEQAYELMLSGPEIFPDESKQFAFLSILHAQHTIHGFRAFVSTCLPDLVKRGKRYGAKKKKSDGVSKSSKPIRNLRRSPRIKNLKVTSKPHQS